METFNTVEGQNKAVAKASVKDYVDRMSLSELRKVEKFISDLRQTDCSQSALIDGLDAHIDDEEMLIKAMKKAVEVGIFPKHEVDTETYLKRWAGMKAVLQTAVGN